jgi:uncharacterized protein (TIGR02996 family)
VEALRRIGQVTARVLCALEKHAARDDHEEIREAARQTLEVLADRLRRGEMRPASLPPEEGFLLSVWQEPQNRALRLIYADWLEERGDSRGELVRIADALASIAADEPRRRELEERREEILSRHWDFGRWWELWQYLAVRQITRP